MLKANTMIIAGKKTYKKGDEIKGLSALDRERMIKDGYVTEDNSEKGVCVAEELPAAGSARGKGRKEKEVAAEKGEKDG